MSRIRDLAEGARSGLEEVLGRIRSGHEELSGVDGPELAAELEARKAGAARKPADNPRASAAGGSAAARKQREGAASEREARIRGARERREQSERAASEAAFRQAKERAAREAEDAYQRFRSSAGASSSGGRRKPSIFGEDRELAKHYKTLHVAYGADLAEVKSAYRKLMRKYHPDLHNQSTKKQKAATELTVQVTQAYNVLEKHLKD